MLKYSEFEKFYINNTTKKYICQFTVAELVDEIRNRSGVSMSSTHYGEELTIKISNPTVALIIDVEEEED